MGRSAATPKRVYAKGKRVSPFEARSGHLECVVGFRGGEDSKEEEDRVERTGLAVREINRSRLN